MNAFLAEPVQTLIASKRLFPFLEDFAAHVYQLDLRRSVSVQKGSNSLRNKQHLLSCHPLQISYIEKLFERRVKGIKLLNLVELLFIDIFEVFVL